MFLFEEHYNYNTVSHIMQWYIVFKYDIIEVNLNQRRLNRMKTYGITDVFDAGEIEARKRSNEPDLDGVKILGFNLIDADQLYLFIKDENNNIVSTIVDVHALLIGIDGVIDEVNELTRKEVDDG